MKLAEVDSGSEKQWERAIGAWSMCDAFWLRFDVRALIEEYCVSIVEIWW